MTDNDHLDHNRADAPPSAIDTALSWRKADTAPALPLELAAADALELVDDLLTGLARGEADLAYTAARLLEIRSALRVACAEEEKT